MSSKEHHKTHEAEPKAQEVPDIVKVNLDVSKKLLNASTMFLEVIEVSIGEFSVLTKTRTGEIKQYRALSGGEKIQIFDGEKEIE